jgi:beta-N-acetylhexosaminidase
MGGFTGFINYYDAICRFWEAGGDVALFPRINETFYEELEKRIEQGKVSVDTLKEKAARIISFKQHTGLFDTVKPEAFNKADHEAASKSMCEKGVSVIRDRYQQLPIPLKNKKILHVYLTTKVAGDNTEVFDRLTGMLKEESETVDTLVNPDQEKLFTITGEKQYELIVCSIDTRSSYGTNVVRLHGPVARSMMRGWTKNDVPVICISHFHPSVHLEYEAVMDIVINTYGGLEAALRKALQCIVSGS